MPIHGNSRPATPASVVESPFLDGAGGTPFDASVLDRLAE